MATSFVCWYLSLDTNISLDHKLGLHTLLLYLHNQHLFEDTTNHCWPSVRADAIIIAPLYAIHANCKQKTSGRIKNKGYCGIYWDVLGWGRHFIYDGYMWSYETDKVNEATVEKNKKKTCFSFSQRWFNFCWCVEMVEMEPRNTNRYMWDLMMQKSVLRAVWLQWLWWWCTAEVKWPRWWL